MKYLRIETTPEKIVTITIDNPETKVNKISSALLDEIHTGLEFIDKQEIKGVVITSAKEDNFIVGADIDELKHMQTDDEIRDYISKAHTILNAIANLNVPVVCAIHGNCLGGGLELALAADYRMASNSTKTVLGLPEVMIGLFPAGGGTHRLPRLIGLKEAMPLLLSGRNVRVKKAKKLGLIDEIISPFGMKEAAIKKVLYLASKKFKRKRKKSLVDFFLNSTSPGRNLVFNQALKMVMKQTHGLYPAPLEIIESVKTGYKKGITRGLLLDQERFVKLVKSSESKSLIKLFFAMNELKKNPYTKNIRSLKKLAVIGTGLMGQGIASISTSMCDTILMKDVDIDTAARGIYEVWKGLEKQTGSGALLPFERDTLYGKLVPCDDYSRFTNTDIVIEAVFENLDLKRKILKDVESATGKNTIFASNTSALPIREIASQCKRPENVIGMHYFSPVPRMPLLEIIKTEKTAQWVIASALEFGISQGKHCIVVKDGPGFYTTRILAPLLFEACLLISEGAKMHDIDRAMLQFGYPVGPITLLDEVGIDVGVHVAETLGPLFKERGIDDPGTLSIMIDRGYLGKKARIGLYRYDLKKKKGVRPENTDVYEIFSNVPRKKFNINDIQHRISLMMVNEAVLCLQEGIVSSPRDGDLGAILGLGFPPFRGGPFRYIDSTGADKIISMMDDLSNRYGRRFTPAQTLLNMASRGMKFYKDE